MLTLYERKSVERIKEYLVKIQETFQSDLNMVESDIVRTKKLIEDARISRKEIQESVDSSYMVLSSSQVAKSQEFAEMDSFDELIEIRNSELDILNQKKIVIEGKLVEINDIIACVDDLNK